MWRAFIGEGRGIRIAERLSRSELLTQSEREAMQSIMQDEVRHRNATYRIALASGPRPDDLVYDRALSSDDSVLLFELSRAEAHLLRSYKHLRPALDADGQVAFDQIVEEEKGHRRVGRRIIHRLGLRKMRVLKDENVLQVVGLAKDMIECSTKLS